MHGVAASSMALSMLGFVIWSYSCSNLMVLASLIFQFAGISEVLFGTDLML